MLDYAKQSQWPNGFGQQQSPIAIDSTTAKHQDGPLLFTPVAPYQLTQELDDQTTIKVLGHGSTEIFHRQFEFQQVHFHAPAEHIINGQQAPFEIHLVHQNKLGQLVVVALLVGLGKADPTFQQIMTAFVSNKDVPVDFQLTNWLPTPIKGFHYLGSLTTPPLTEGVEWLVIPNAQVTLSQAQLDWFQSHFSNNNRTVQSLNGRTVLAYG